MEPKLLKILFLKSNYKDSIYKYIKFADQREEAGYKYSDLGYYLLKEALEDSYKEPLNTLVDVYFYKPLGANRTGYLPLERFSKKDIVPTEKDNYYRNQLLHGNVHDMGAAMLGGVGGHAVYLPMQMMWVKLCNCIYRKVFMAENGT